VGDDDRSARRYRRAARAAGLTAASLLAAAAVLSLLGHGSNVRDVTLAFLVVAVAAHFLSSPLYRKAEEIQWQAMGDQRAAARAAQGDDDRG
jgi:hypothetical protein